MQIMSSILDIKRFVPNKSFIQISLGIQHKVAMFV